MQHAVSQWLPFQLPPPCCLVACWASFGRSSFCYKSDKADKRRFRLALHPPPQPKPTITIPVASLLPPWTVTGASFPSGRSVSACSVSFAGHQKYLAGQDKQPSQKNVELFVTSLTILQLTHASSQPRSRFANPPSVLLPTQQHQQQQQRGGEARPPLTASRRTISAHTTSSRPFLIHLQSRSSSSQVTSRRRRGPPEETSHKRLVIQTAVVRFVLPSFLCLIFPLWFPVLYQPERSTILPRAFVFFFCFSCWWMICHNSTSAPHCKVKGQPRQRVLNLFVFHGHD